MNRSLMQGFYCRFMAPLTTTNVLYYNFCKITIP